MLDCSGADCGGNSLPSVVYPGPTDLGAENHKPLSFKCTRPKN